MQLNYDTTRQILAALYDLIDASRVTISTENTNHIGQRYPSDDVTLEQMHHIGFENFGTFVQVADEHVSLHKYDWDILIHIRRAGNAYTFGLERYYFDDEDTLNFYWYSLSIPGISLYDTEDKAFAAATEPAGQYRITHKDRSLFKP